MKKWTVLMMATTVFFAGCAKEETHEPPEQAEEEQQEKEAEEKIYEGLLLSVEPTLEDNKIHSTISLENSSEEAIPLNMNEHQLFKIIIQDDKGNVIKEETVTEEGRNAIQPKEKVTWGKEIALEEEKSSFSVTVVMLLENRENEFYTEGEMRTSKELKGNKMELGYLPNEEKTYIYDELSNHGEVKEAFKYFKGGYVQSESTFEGTKVYLYDKDGLHLLYMNDYNEINKNIIDEIDPDKKTLLKFPIQLNSTWQVDGVAYTVSSVDGHLETPYGEFENVVAVDLSNGTTLHYHESVGLIQIDAGGKTMLTIKAIQ